MASGNQTRRRFDHHTDSDLFRRSVSLGLVEGWSVQRIFAMNDAVNGAGTTEDVWPLGTVKVWPTAPAVASLVSSSAADTAAGTGAQTVVVVGLDSSYQQVTEVVEMAGLSAATSTQEFLRINGIYCARVGSAGVNVGNITCSVGGNAQKYIEADEGNCHCASWTVPANHSFILDSYSVGVGRMAGSSDCQLEGQIRLYDTESNANYQSWRSISDIYLYNGQDRINGSNITTVPAKTDIRGQVTSTSSTQVFMIFGGLLVDNKYL